MGVETFGARLRNGCRLGFRARATLTPTLSIQRRERGKDADDFDVAEMAAV